MHFPPHFLMVTYMFFFKSRIFDMMKYFYIAVCTFQMYISKLKSKANQGHTSLINTQ